MFPLDGGIGMWFPEGGIPMLFPGVMFMLFCGGIPMLFCGGIPMELPCPMPILFCWGIPMLFPECMPGPKVVLGMPMLFPCDILIPPVCMLILLPGMPMLFCDMPMFPP